MAPPGVGLGGQGAGARGAGATRVTFAWTGLRETLDLMGRWHDDVLEELKIATEEELNALLRDAKAMTPVDTGRLQESGRVLAPRTSKTAVKVDFQVIFGAITVRGRFVDYALIVHETHPSKSKFLERAEQEHMPGMPDRIEKKVLSRVKT